ncbi:MAG: 3-oxoacyl-[acyl-carrier-protein] reductase [Candidatus Tectomicrobia bacterium]|uniref:3-oxoacyl-[acyl-carrier-protein] reductase n=1 Tax=Tectimicrobiota bacterium TaxID=2528274 RepID=A0A932M1U8_UNCTE|nr:3-oxoacyl-[acyl-carrier-protein] reductase [Candidatus Tectomicrobia bacterium]
MGLRGRVALVTGGGRGIGADVARGLAARGARVFINYLRDTTAAERVKGEICSAGGEAEIVQANVAYPADVKRMFERVSAEGGRLDFLINNAGVTRDGLLLRMSEDDWDYVLDTNLKSTFLCSKAAARLMVRQRFGRIVNISSVAGIMGNPGQANYAAAKAGIVGFTKAVAKELASRGITVNAVAPGLVDTDMTRSMPERAREAILGTIPLGRVGLGPEVMAVVEFLLSEEASYITGQVLHVNGGMWM